MGIVHIRRPGHRSALDFRPGVVPSPVGEHPSPKLASDSAFEAEDGSVSTGTWEASPGTFARAIVDAEFSHFISGHATFVTAAGDTFDFRGGDAAYFPPNTKGVWTIHETLRKTYCIWR